MALRVGQPWERSFVWLARLFPNLVLVGDNPPGHWAKEFIDVLGSPAGDGSGSDLTARVVWGTNGRVPATEDLSAIKAMKMDEAVRARFLGDNAARLLHLGGAA
jgi:predicted TIM-barrel fold metal-dependent hydrolase